MQGEKSSIYYAYSKDLKNIGAQYGFPTAGEGAGPGLGNKGGIVTLVKRGGQAKFSSAQSLVANGSGFDVVDGEVTEWQQGDVIGENVYTLYVRFHARVESDNILAESARIKARHALQRQERIKNGFKGVKGPNVVPQEETESKMSYADLQAELAQMKFE